ncbi:cytochrome P450 [Streptomyces sp. AP-93]|uniref:cytochrome P450 n=1 Tax=Streptomyces sp. AP-93 TaxID=2929048 RepID=UPI001FAFEC1F|nr:cytochrome P450 [Streptomyces sp. AP-93]MCJ0873244.1 cytochrome P450 [Streptomyces sp. AP-93]
MGVAREVPGAWPLLGHALPLVRRPLSFVTALARSGDVVRIRLGPLPVYAVTDPALVHRVLVSEAPNFKRGRFHERATRVFGQGLLATSGTVHVSRRRTVQPAFHRARIDAYTKAMSDAAVRISESWHPGQVVAVDHVMNDLSLAMLASTLFPSEFGVRAAAELQHAVPLITRAAVVRAVLPAAWAKLPTRGNRRLETALAGLDAAVAEAIAECRSTGRDQGDLLSMLLAVQDAEGRGLTDREIQDQVMNFAVAGVETTGATLAWVFHELGRNPEVEQRLHAEVDGALAGRAPGHEDLTTLELTGRVILEALRLYAACYITRRTQGPVELGGTRVPAGAEVLFSPYALHRDPRWFPDPERFDPDRWLPERAAQIPRGAYLPFGSGGHQCIGNTFALAEMTAALAVICQRWRLRPLPGAEVRPVARATVHPSQLPMTAESRTGG